jgi:hypothetical protein
MSVRRPFDTLWMNNPVPPTQRKMFQFTHSQVYSPGTGSLLGPERIYLLNSMTPTYSGAAAAYGSQTWGLLYNLYVVEKVDIEIEATDPSGGGCYVYANVQASSDAFTLSGQEQDQVQNWPGVWAAPINNTGVNVTKCFQTISMARLEGITTSEMIGAQTQYSGVLSGSGAAPTKTPRLRVATATLSGAPTVYITVRIRFHVYLFDRVLPNTTL